MTEPADIAPDMPNFAVGWLTLRFADQETERRFGLHCVISAVMIIRQLLLGACLLFAIFGILDYYIIPDHRNFAWFVRYAIVCPFLLSVFVLSFWEYFAQIAQAMFSLAVLVAGIGIIAMIAVADAPGNGLYYAGLIIVMLLGSCIGRLRWVYAGALSLVLTALYNIAVIWINPVSKMVLINNDFFLGTSIVISAFTCYMQEMLIRQDFASAEMLRREKARSDNLLTDAQAANKAKSDFLAVMSHELRTPLNAILGFAEVMQRRMFGPIGSERYVGYVDDIHHAAGHLLNIITDILDLSKAEVGKLTLYEEPVSLCDVLDQCCRLMREKAAESGLRLLFKVPPERPLLRADTRLVKQVLINLLSNAIKFTPAGGSVTITIGRIANGDWETRVIDTGIGIAKPDVPRVLEPFVQVESALARKHGGTGLGLPLAKKVMELHGGSVIIDSVLGSGTTVTIRFPAERTLEADSPVSSVA